MKSHAALRAKVIDGKQEAGAKFSDYFDHHERWANVPSHRALAMLRGRNEEILMLEIQADADDVSTLKPAEKMIADAFAIPVSGTAADRSEEHTSELQSLMRIPYAGLWLTKKILRLSYIRSAQVRTPG